jgi:energy-coupling factor transporter ATP-binding protein EcfA2
MPFVLLKLWRVPISFEVYLKTLRDVSKTHFIGRLINIKEWNFENAMYALFIGGMYILQTYNQVVYVFKYHTSIKRMNSNLLFLRDYLDCTIGSMDSFVRLTAGLSYYGDFCQDVHSHKLVLLELRDLIGDSLTPYGWTLRKVGELGHMFHCYYQIYASMDYEASLKYSVGFEGYIDLLRGVERGVKAGFLGKAAFLKAAFLKAAFLKAAFPAPPSEEEQEEQEEQEEVQEKEQLIFEGQYYPAHKNTAYIQNTVDLSTNLIITGVNASGKTTTLKTTALNIIFSQQVGYGFYESATLVPFKHIHSYLNIPDTSGRDSLFQAESRRCKEILDKIKDAPITETHFVIFDELYSGTNPKEAAKSAHSLLKYLAKKDNVRFILTTHYVEVCKKFKKSEKVKNYKMIVERTEAGGFKYTYKMRKGISTMEGGIAILKTMDYPAEILNDLTANNP